MLTVLHASDFQCGRPFRSAAADALVRLAEEAAPDVVVVSGDLTQRAKVREFQMASSILDRMPRVPHIVTPGNHDVPLFRVWERAFTPYRNWRRCISPELNTVTRVEGATFVALNSSAPRRTIVDGRIDPDQVDFARSAFETTPPDDVRVLVIHHHFVPVHDGKGGRPLPRARQVLADFEAMKVDFVLGGHVHQTHISTSSDLIEGGGQAGIPLIACGTTTSWRGRGLEADLNSLNVLRIKSEEIEVTPHLLAAGGRAFEPLDPIVFRRHRRSGTSEVPGSEVVR
jgi:3',5'-cyclic AMP phosphodiesterase CpdA